LFSITASSGIGLVAGHTDRGCATHEGHAADDGRAAGGRVQLVPDRSALSISTDGGRNSTTPSMPPPF